MAQTYNEQVVVDGSDDEIQLRVQGHTTQTEPLQTWEDSAEEILAQVTDGGLLQVGDIPPLSTPTSLVQIHREGTSTNKPTRGLQVSGELEDEPSGDVKWSVHELTVSGTDTELDRVVSLRASLLADDAPLDAAIGIEIELTKLGSETIAEAIGLQIADVDQADANYAIFTGSGTVHVGDVFEIPVVSGTPSENPETDFVKLYAREVNGKPTLHTKDSVGVERIASGAFEDQTANTVFAGPTTGAAAQPVFRSVVAADIASGVLDNARVNWAAPSAIGNTSANSGSFTTISTTSNIVAGAAGANAARLNVNAAASQVGLTVRANSTTPGNVVEWQNGAGTVLGSVTPAGTLNVNYQSTANNQVQTAMEFFSTVSGTPQTNFGSQIVFSAKGNGTSKAQVGAISWSWGQASSPRRGTVIISAQDDQILASHLWLNGDWSQLGGRWDTAETAAVFLNAQGNTTSSQTSVKNALNLNVTGKQSPSVGGNGFGAGLLFSADSSTTAWQSQGRVYTAWDDSTHASRRARMSLTVNNITTEVIGLTIATDTSSNPRLGFFGATPINKPAVTGSRGGNAALASLLTELANLGLITDGTT